MTDLYPAEPTPRRWRRWLLIGGGLALVGLVGVILAAAHLRGAAQDHLAAARRHLQAGQPRAAIIELQNAVQAHPDDPRVWIAAGAMALRLGDLATAERNFVKSRRLGADDGDVLLPLAEAYLRQGQHERLLNVVTASERDAVYEASVQAYRARAHMALGDLAAARAAIDRALALRPGQVDARTAQVELLGHEGKAEAAEAALDAVLAEAPDNTRALIMKADLRRAAGDPAGFEAALTAAIEADPYLPQARVGRADLRLSQGRVDQAKADIDALLRLYPGLPLARYLNALYFARSDRDADAVAELQQMGGAQRRYPPALFLLGMLSLRANQLEQAESNLRTLLGITPAHPAARELLATVYLRKQRPDRAIELLEPMHEADPDDVDLASRLADAYLRDDRPAAAAALLGRLVDQNPDDLKLRTQAAASRLRSGETAAAIADLEDILRGDRTASQAGMLLVMSHIQANDLDRALAAARAMQEALPDSAMPDNLVGSILARRGDLAGARPAFEAALAKDPAFGLAQLNLARLDEREGDVDGARDRYKAMLAREPDAVPALLALAELELRAGDGTAQLAWLRRAVDAAPAAARPRVALTDALLQQRRYPAALDVARGFDATVADEPAALDVLARAYLANDQPANALASYRRLALLQPESVHAHRRLARTLLGVGNRREARLSLRDALARQPDSAALLADLVRLELADGRHDAAAAAAAKVVALQPDLATGHVLTGDVLMAAGDPQAAVDAYRQALDRAPAGRLIQKLHAAYAAAGQAPAALATLDDWLAQHPDDHGVRFLRAVYNAANGRTAPAIADYERITAALPDSHVVLNNLALLYDATDDPRALPTAERAVAAAADRPEVVDTLGWLLARRGEGARAVSLLLGAVAARPDNPAMRYHLAYAHHVAGTDDAAVGLLTALLREHPTFAERTDAEALLRKLAE